MLKDILKKKKYYLIVAPIILLLMIAITITSNISADTNFDRDISNVER